MKVTVLAVGRLKERHFREAADEYLKRLGPYATVEMLEVADRDVSRDETRARAEEGTALLRAIPTGAYVVALDISGTQRSSERFADWLGEGMVGGRSHVVFVLGGAAGLAPEVLEGANERMSLGPMTLPHQMARVLVLEQVYRAFRIIRGEPYHH